MLRMANARRYLRYCEVCGVGIPSKYFNGRLPENKINLCSKHLNSKRMKEMHNKK